MGVGVYICKCGGNISEKLDMQRLEKAVGALPGVSYVETVGLSCSHEGKETLGKSLAEKRPERIVIAACSPRDHELTFRNIMKETGLNPYMMQMANIREHVAWVTADKNEATEKALRYINAAVKRALLNEPLEEKHLDANTDVLIIGAGPAGLKAALAISESGRKAVLVEKSPYIGGLPVLFEEIFPNMECGTCMLEPMMDDVLHGEHAPNIELLTMSEVAEIKGFFGNFTASIKRSPRYISTDACIGCGECVNACPVSADNPYNGNLDARKAVAFTFTGALPNAPYIDPALCLRMKGEACSLCKDACPVEGAVNYEDKEELIERDIGAVLIAVGAGLYDMKNIPNLSYGKLPEVYTSMEFERLLAQNGPYAGELKTRAGRHPNSVCIIHCAGSLDKAHKEYCSGICCQDAFKFNLMIKEKYPEAKLLHLYKELVVPSKEGYSVYNKARSAQDVSFVRYHDIKNVQVGKYGEGMKVSYVNNLGGSSSFAADMVVLCPPIVMTESGRRLVGMLDLSLDREGFIEELHARIDSARSKIKGVYIAGTCTSPMDIRSAMNQSMAAAGHILSALSPGRKLDISPVTANVDPDRCGGCMVCMSVCPYKAVQFNISEGKAMINEVLCQGCGTCVAACPSGAIKGSHFTKEQIMAEIEGVLG